MCWPVATISRWAAVVAGNIETWNSSALPQASISANLHSRSSAAASPNSATAAARLSQISFIWAIRKVNSKHLHLGGTLLDIGSSRQSDSAPPLSSE